MLQTKNLIQIREINPNSDEEIALVACRMQKTLIEVMGEKRGSNFYSMEWLVERVHWHLNPDRIAKIFLTENENGDILGHAIARVDQKESGKPFGYFSTIYVEPKLRGKGVATLLVGHVDNWLKSMNMQKIIYNTAKEHTILIKLFKSHGYQVAEQEGEMTRLIKFL